MTADNKNSIVPSNRSRSRGQLDELDTRIIAILRDNGRTPAIEIARRLDISEGAIRKRMRRLEKENVLQIVATSSIRLLGYRYEMKIMLKTAPQKTRQVISNLKSLSRVRYIAIVGGDYNLDLIVAFESVRSATGFLVDELACIDGVIECNAVPVLRVVKRSYDWLADDDLLEGNELLVPG